MKQKSLILQRALNRQRGQGMTEYIIIVALVAVAAIGAYSFFGKTVRNQMAGISKVMAGESGDAEITAAKAAATKAATEGTNNYNLGSYNDAHGNIQ